jgi:DNA-binding MarR family transcriptional regulator
MPQEPAPPAELAALVQALRRFAEASDRTTEAAGHHSGMYRTDLRALAVLMQRHQDGQDTTPTDLGRLLNLTSASTTALVDRLVASGHAQRQASTTDRRRVNITHTPAAIAEGRAIFMPLARQMASSLSGFTPGQMRTAIEVLQAATASMDSMAPLGQATPPPGSPAPRPPSRPAPEDGGR